MDRKLGGLRRVAAFFSDWQVRYAIAGVIGYTSFALFTSAAASADQRYLTAAGLAFVALCIAFEVGCLLLTIALIWGAIELSKYADNTTPAAVKDWMKALALLIGGGYLLVKAVEAQATIDRLSGEVGHLNDSVRWQSERLAELEKAEGSRRAESVLAGLRLRGDF